MATSHVAYPSSPSHFMRSPDSSFAGGDWADPPNPHMSGSSQALTSITAPRRPKLSLNTTCSRSLNRTSGLRLDTLSAISPTVRNTYANGFEDAQHNVQSATSVARMVLPKVVIPTASRVEQPVSVDDRTRLPFSESVSCTTAFKSDVKDSTSTILVKSVTQTQMIPYIHPSNLRSILANSPLLDNSPLRRSTRTVTSVMLSRKRVCFADQLDEEISTATYTARHSDLPSRTPSPALHDTAASSANDGSDAAPSNFINSSSNMARVNKLTRKREEIDNDHDDKSIVAQTPVAGRRKRQRDWIWTLDILPQDNARCPTSNAIVGVSNSEDDQEASSTAAQPTSITSQVFEALHPAITLCETVKDKVSHHGLVSSVREIVDDLLGSTQ